MSSTAIDSFPQRKKDLFVTVRSFRLNSAVQQAQAFRQELNVVPARPSVVTQEVLDAMEHNRLINIETGSRWPLTDSEDEDDSE